MSTHGLRFLVALCAASLLCAPSASAAVGTTRLENGAKVPASSPGVPGTKLACLRKDGLRYTGKVKPRGTCEIGGLVEDAYNNFYGTAEPLGRGGSFARFRIGGYLSEPRKREPIDWLNWGSFYNLGLGTNVRNEHEVSITLYRRFKCIDGSTWYSRVDVADSQTAVSFFLRLPVCGSGVKRGTLGTG